MGKNFLIAKVGESDFISGVKLLPIAAAGGMVLLASCSAIPSLGKKKEDPMAGMKAYRAVGGQMAGYRGGTQTRVKVGPAAGITADKDIVWAPENPNEEIGGGLEELWKKPENKSWVESYPHALRMARENGKPILLWFTNTARSPLCRTLSAEVFSSGEFEAWAKEKIVRCRIDTHLGISGELRGKEVSKKRQIEYLKKRYKVMGHPTVVMLSPSGSVMASYRGYKKGGKDYYWGRIRQVTRNAEREYGAWREKYEKRGYRLWMSRDGRKIFAKLYRFSDNRVTLIDPDGKRGTTSLARLCDADQQWILAEKKKYEARRGR